MLVLRKAILALPLLILLVVGEARAQDLTPTGKGDWTGCTKPGPDEVSHRYICDGYDSSARRYAMRFAFRNDSAKPVIVTYRGENSDGSHYVENQYLEPGEVAEKECQGAQPKLPPCKIVKVRHPS